MDLVIPYWNCGQIILQELCSFQDRVLSCLCGSARALGETFVESPISGLAQNSPGFLGEELGTETPIA